MERLRELFAPLLARYRVVQARAGALRDRATDTWNRLSPRDQQIVTWVVSVVGTLMVIAVIYLGNAHLGTLQRQIGVRTKQLAQVHDMRTDYSEQKQRLEQMNAKLKASTGRSQTFLEEKAKEVHVDGSLDGMREVAAPPNDLFKSQVVEVKLKKISLANLTRYLQKVEGTGVGLSIRSLHLESNFQDGKYLNATIEVLSLRPKEE